MERAVDDLMSVLDRFLDAWDSHLDEGRDIDVGEHARRIDRAMNVVNCVRSGITPPNKPGPKKAPHLQR